jgi:hypothetical protein
MSKKLDVWFYDPAANPNWQDDDNYYEWHSPASSEPSSGDLTAAHDAYLDALEFGALLIESNKSSIVGNGTDAATVTITYRLPYPDHVIIAIGELSIPVYFPPKSWAGSPYTRTASITNIISDLPGEDIVIDPLDWYFDCPAGNTLVIEVTA